MIELNDKNRDYIGFIITYITYILVLLSIIYYGFFMLNDINWGIIGTIILISTGFIYPILYYRSLKLDKEEIEK